jgi:hypothetical protein
MQTAIERWTAMHFARSNDDDLLRRSAHRYVSPAGPANYFEPQQEQASSSTSSTCSRDSPVRFWMRPINSHSLPSTN